MVWFKVDDDLAFHAKALRAGNAAMGVWVRAGSQCGKQLTDGFIDREVALTIGRAADVKRLVDAGLWEPAEVDGRPGWRFHDFLERNPSRAEVEAKRKEETDRKAAWRAKRAAQKAERAGRDESGTDSDVPPGHLRDETRDNYVSPAGVTDLSRSSRPDPTRPDPVSPNGDTSSLRSGGRAGRGTRLPDDFAISDEMRSWAHEQGWADRWIDAVTEQFRDYWRGKPGQSGVKTDWPATWRNWLRRDAERGQPVTAAAAEVPNIHHEVPPWERFG